MLEMFNTLLRQLRLSIDYALTGSYDGAVTLGTKIIKEHEECMFQEAVIKTIGGARGGAQGCPSKSSSGCGRNAVEQTLFMDRGQWDPLSWAGLE